MRSLTSIELRALIDDQGHSFGHRAANQGTSTDVYPPPHMITTVAIDVDAALDPAYRQRYFTCRLNGDDIPILQNAPEFAFTPMFASLAKQVPAHGGFVDGPFRWLLRRLQLRAGVLLWIPDNFRDRNGNWLFRDWQVKELPRLVHRWEQIASASEAVGAIHLDLSCLRDVRVMWEIANHVATRSDNFYISSCDVREVYLLHHHDKIVVSIPDEQRRQELLDNLRACKDLLKDCSGYTSESDDGSE